MSIASTAAVANLNAADAINQLAGIASDIPLAALRAQRPELVRYAEGSYRALFEPEDLGGVSAVDRDLIALRVAILTDSATLVDHHQARLRRAGVTDQVLVAVATNPAAAHLSPRQQAILQHVDRLTTAPVTATADHITALTVVGLTPRDIVVISQLTAFLSFQLRTLVGLRILAEEK
ncbi:MAG: CMD domain protein [Caldilineaceae bacterium]